MKNDEDSAEDGHDKYVNELGLPNIKTACVACIMFLVRESLACLLVAVVVAVVVRLLIVMMLALTAALGLDRSRRSCRASFAGTCCCV